MANLQIWGIRVGDSEMYEKKGRESRLHEQVSGPMREVREAELPFWMSEGKRTSQKWLSSSKVENGHIRRAQDKTSPPSWKMVTAISTFQFFQKIIGQGIPQRWVGLVKTHAILQEGERYLSWMSPPHDTQVDLYCVAKCVPEFLFNDAENWIYWTQYKVAESKSWLEENYSQKAGAPERPMLFPNLGY